MKKSGIEFTNVSNMFSFHVFSFLFLNWLITLFGIIVLYTWEVLTDVI